MIYDTYETDGVPAPYDCELVDTRVRYVVVHPPALPFVAHDLTTDRLVVIVGRTGAGNWVDRRGYLHQWKDITDDLGGYAAMQAADAQDQHDTHQDALW